MVWVQAAEANLDQSGEANDVRNWINRAQSGSGRKVDGGAGDNGNGLQKARHVVSFGGSQSAAREGGYGHS